MRKIKHFYTHVPYELLFGIILILVGFSSFGLGRLSTLEETRLGVVTGYDTTIALEPSVVVEGRVVTSRNGKKYHFPWCAGALKMNESNKRWYDSIEDARAAGYLPAGNCKGLE